MPINIVSFALCLIVKTKQLQPSIDHSRALLGKSIVLEYDLFADAFIQPMQIIAVSHIHFLLDHIRYHCIM
jgi:hypothetical protein